METIGSWADRLGGITLIEHAARRPSTDWDRAMPKPGIALGVPPAVAQVNAGRWVAMCPTGDGGAEYVDLARATFFCCECRNASTGGVPIPLVMPDESMRTLIEGALLARPDAKTRNWLPVESVADLMSQNAAHGVGA